MRKNNWIHLIIGICLGFGIWNLGFPSHGATWLDPGLKWKTIETPHFSITYHLEEEKIAKEFAPMAEDVYNKLTPVFKHRPDMKTEVLLVDTTDFGNGSTNLVPNPHIILYLTDWASNLNPSKHAIWLKFVFLHEYTHLLHLDITDGAPSLFRMIFGRIFFMNALSPWFIIEGLATYTETTYTQDGRGKDPRWEMMMRMDILEDNIKSIDQAASDTVQWPTGRLRYLYGVKFLQYLSATYGEDKLISLTHVYGDFLLSMGIDGAFIAIYRKNLSMLWEEWLDDARNKYTKQKESLGKLTEPRLVTDTGYENLKPKWAKDSQHLFYEQNNADGYPAIRMVDTIGGRDDKLIEAQITDNSLNLDPSGKSILFSKYDIYKNFYVFKDLYTYDLEKRKLGRLTNGKRIGDAAFSPDGGKIVYVKNQLGTNTLMLMGSDTSNPQLLVSYEANVQYFSPTYHPDGNRIAFAKWSPGGEQKIYLLDTTTGKQTRITTDIDLTSEANPAFSPVGDYLFFDSDRTGIVNLYAYQMKNGQLFQVTNVLGGAMMPDISSDGKKIAYVSYSSKGYDIAVMDLDTSVWKEVVNKTGTKEAGGGSWEAEPKVNYKIHDYNPLPSLTPKFWLPLSYYNENGPQNYVYTQSSDILGQHMYALEFGYDFQVKRPQYLFQYINNQWLPQFVIQAYDNAVPYDWMLYTLWMREKYGSFAVYLYDNRVFSEWDKQLLTFGIEQTNLSNISSLEGVFPKPSLGNINGFFVAWRYLNSRMYTKSISPEDGIDLTLKVTMNSSALGSDYTFTNYSSKVSTYFPMPFQHHVLAPNVYGFYNKGDRLVQSTFSWKYLPIRGYPDNDLAGNKGVLLSTEYRFPLFRPEAGLLYGNTFFENIWSDLFYDAGGATFGPVANLKLKRSYGTELNFDTSFFWGYYALTIKLGYVKGLDENGEEKFYFTFSL